jgi:hypothetical protein
VAWNKVERLARFAKGQQLLFRIVKAIEQLQTAGKKKKEMKPAREKRAQ